MHSVEEVAAEQGGTFSAIGIMCAANLSLETPYCDPPLSYPYRNQAPNQHVLRGELHTSVVTGETKWGEDPRRSQSRCTRSRIMCVLEIVFLTATPDCPS